MESLKTSKSENAAAVKLAARLKEDVHSKIIENINEFFVSANASGSAPGLMEMLRYYPDSRGKYSRPTIMTLCAMALGASYEECILPAATIQLSEDFVLIHDDIEDMSILRRGGDTLHRRYGIERAINAGDIIHSIFEQMLHNVSKGNNGEAVYDKFKSIGHITAIGQDMDIYYTGAKALTGSEQDYMNIAAYKTSAYSVYGPLQIGALVAGAGKAELNVLRDIGLPAGIAFQIKDDINDFLGVVPGKRAYEDIRRGKLTLLSTRAYSESNVADKGEMADIYAKSPDDKTYDDIRRVRSIMAKTHAMKYASDKKRQYEQASIKALLEGAEQIPGNAYSKELLSFIASVYR